MECSSKADNAEREFRFYGLFTKDDGGRGNNPTLYKSGLVININRANGSVVERGNRQKAKRRHRLCMSKRAARERDPGCARHLLRKCGNEEKRGRRGHEIVAHLSAVN